MTGSRIATAAMDWLELDDKEPWRIKARELLAELVTGEERTDA